MNKGESIMMHTYPRKRFKSQPSHSGALLFGLWIALFIPMVALGTAFIKLPEPVVAVAGENVVAQSFASYAVSPNVQQNAVRTNTVRTLERQALLEPNQAARAQAIAELSNIRQDWSKTINIPLTQWGAFTTATQNENKVVVAVKRDLYISNDRGNTFEQLVGVLPSQVNSLAINTADENVMYAGVDGLGFYVSTNNGLSWTPMNTGIGVTPGARFGITAIEVNENNADELFIAAGVWLGTSQVTWHPMGVLHTENGGETWTQIETQVAAPIQYLFLNGDRLYTLSNGQPASYAVRNTTTMSED
jgi:hypothetical protein